MKNTPGIQQNQTERGGKRERGRDRVRVRVAASTNKSFASERRKRTLQVIYFLAIFGQLGNRHWPLATVARNRERRTERVKERKREWERGSGSICMHPEWTKLL